jgi:hypothetical protein
LPHLFTANFKKKKLATHFRQLTANGFVICVLIASIFAIGFVMIV